MVQWFKKNILIVGDNLSKTYLANQLLRFHEAHQL
jgi:hypothetical protein